MVSGRPSSILIAVALGARFLVPTPAFATADPVVLSMPSAFVPDNTTEHAVFCSISAGYPNNVYAIKGVFSNGDLPYYGVNYNPNSLLWVPQIGSWSESQRRVQTDAKGTWKGFLYIRLEPTAPRKDLQFRLSVIPLSPISNPGPTVGDWVPTAALDSSLGGRGGWLSGHVFLDAGCTVPAEAVVVCLWEGANGSGRLLGAYLSQDSKVRDGRDHTDLGAFLVSARSGPVGSLTGRDRYTGASVRLYTRKAPPWTVLSGRVACIDNTVWGDVDGDGALTAADAVTALRLASGLTVCDEEQRRAASVWDGAGSPGITLGDAVVLLRQACGIQSVSPSSALMLQ